MSRPHTIRTFASALVLSGLAAAQNTTRVSVDSAGAEGNGASDARDSLNSVSADGNVVAFYSDATNLVPGDTNGQGDIFVHDRSSGITERVSVDSAGAEANGKSPCATLSTDGRFVVFASDATNLVTGDTNGYLDVFVHDRTTKITERVSVDSAGAEGNSGTAKRIASSISENGRWVVFTSNASNLVGGDTNGTWDVFVHDRTTGTTERVNVDSGGKEASGGGQCGAISADGNVVAFYSASDDLVASDTNGYIDAFVHDRTTGITERVSVSSSEAEGNYGSLDSTIAISPDGQVVVFGSLAENFGGFDHNALYDIFLRDRTAGTTEIVSVDSSGVVGDSSSFGPSISADARFVAFTSYSTNLVTGDTNLYPDVFVHDRTTGITERVSVDATGGEGNSACIIASISADGEVVVFASYSDDLVSGDNNKTYDIFARDRCDAYWSSYGAGFQGTNGIPSLTSQTDPVLGTTVTIDLTNSLGGSTVGVLLIGYARTEIPTNRGGSLLVDPTITILAAIPASGTSFSADVPDDEALCGFKFDLQAIEIDPGAAKGLSFTPGLELVLGR